VEWIQIGGAAPTADEVPTFSDGKSLSLPHDGALAYYVQVPAGGALAVQGCAPHVRATAHGGTVEGEGAVDLAKLAGAVARLELSSPGGECRLTAAALTTDGEAPTVKRAPAPRNVVFWMTDDTRSDKYRIYNPKTRVETPVMDALVRRATNFRVAYVQGNESRVSHASLWTGMYPAQHHFIAEKAKLDPRFVTLAEAVKPSGLYTQGFMANGFIDAFWGFADGWDGLKNNIHDGGGLKAEDLVKEAGAFLVQRSAKPFFLYLGTIDAHVSWRAHAPWIAKYDPEPYAGPFVKACLDPQLDQIVAGKLRVSERDKTRIIALYDSDVSYNDQQLGVLLKALESRGHGDDTMVIVTADHGEELWDHGRIGHGQSLREELVHVPLVIYYPPLFPAGRAVDEGVELVDLLPTITEALGLPAPTEAQGESLVGLAQGEGAGYPRPAIGSQYELAHTMRLGRWKLWVGGSGEVRLYDAVADAAEANELSAARPLERRFVTDALSLWMAYQARWHKARWGVASNHKPALPADLERN
jgi:arylsulfatase A-like enzyme